VRVLRLNGGSPITSKDKRCVVCRATKKAEFNGLGVHKRKMASRQRIIAPVHTNWPIVAFDKPNVQIIEDD